MIPTALWEGCLGSTNAVLLLPCPCWAALIVLPMLLCVHSASHPFCPCWTIPLLQVGEELTYDYRFSGKEQLPCNCGEPCCRCEAWPLHSSAVPCLCVVCAFA